MRGMFYIYGIIDPRTSEVHYVGRTGVSIKKRLCDHIAAARFFKGRDLPVMIWLNSLLDEGIRPEAIELARTEDLFEAMQLEAQYIALHGKVNSPTGTVVGGKPVGKTDPEQTRKRRAHRPQARGPSTAEYQRRAALGYPHPEFPYRHPLNLAHHNMRLRMQNSK